MEHVREDWILVMLDQLKNPPTQYRTAPVWVWARLPKLEDIHTEVREMHGKGVGGFFIDNRTPRLSPEHDDAVLERMRCAWDVAHRLGIQVYGADQLDTTGDFSALSIKLRSSRAHAEGRMRIAGAVRGKGWDTALEDIKREIDREAALGISFFSPQPFQHTIVGESRALAPGSQFYQATYWSHYRLIADYAARLAYVMSVGHHCAQAAVVRPGCYDSPLDSSASDWLDGICSVLLAQHVDFDILDEDALCRSACREDRLVLGDESYEVVILPPMQDLAFEAASKLCAFVEEEGKVIATSCVPAEDSRGDRHAGVREAFAVMREIAGELFLDVKKPGDLPAALKQALQTSIKPRISIKRGADECADILCTHRIVDGADVFVLANMAPEAREVRLSIRCDGAPLLVSLESGDITALPNCTQQGNRTVLLHRIERSGSLVVAFGDEPAWYVVPQPLDEGQEIALSDEWAFSIDQPNCLGLPEWSFNTLIQADNELYEYSTSFNAEALPENLMLVIEDQPGFGPDAGMLLFVNDMPVTVQNAWVYDVGLRAFDIASLTRLGSNRVRMLVEREGWTGDPVPSPARPRLMGDFVLDSSCLAIREQPGKIRNGSWTDQGYPFYSGTASYEQTLYVPEFARGQRIVVRAEGVTGIVEFLLNGAIASVRCWAPYEADVTALARPGANTLELRVTNTLANTINLQPLPSGLLRGAVALLA